jgi:hypothetical protein
MPFKLLGLEENCTECDVLRAWRRLAREHHPDRTDSRDDTLMKALNEAKEQCLKAIICRNYTVSEQEYVSHVCRVLEQRIGDELDLGQGNLQGRMIRPRLREFIWVLTVDAMDWILRCGVGDMEFEQSKEDELPILCKYYNDFIGEGDWSDEDHTMMTVLNRYEKIKAGGYGNFARFLTQDGCILKQCDDIYNE